MLRIYEFEVFPEDGLFAVQPFDFEGATMGTDFADACKNAADWLRTNCEMMEIERVPLPEPTLGNVAEHGGRVVIVAVDAGLDTIRKMTASEAARALGVSPGRVTQMISAGLLSAWREGSRTWVTTDSVEARKAEGARPGRPPKRKASVAEG